MPAPLFLFMYCVTAAGVTLRAAAMSFTWKPSAASFSARAALMIGISLSSLLTPDRFGAMVPVPLPAINLPSVNNAVNLSD